MTVLDIPTVKLVNGADIPQVGLGTWPMSDEEAEVAVADAVEMGYRLVDTAYAYGNETGVGRGLRASGVPREELFVTTKLNGEWHGYDAAQEAYQASLDRLGLDHADLYLIHWPLPREDRYVEAWKGMVKLLRDGRVRAIGVSNFKPAHIDRLLAETGVVPDVNQIQLNPFFTRDEPRAYDAEHGIATQSWGPLGQGGDLLEQPVVTAAAERHGRTPAQIVLRWHIELGLITVPKSSSPERMRANADVFGFTLTPAEVAELSSLDRGEAAATDSDSVGH
ncbi:MULTISPECIES: aldo/keto reductase [unclassified Streptosporangium]|uniref:aldo/keto reductase n=1 Tax=unclassified Streptosporangium TaxID=2632669 RepID=UPI002E27E6B0|nr:MULTISPECIES: aldo/keto reductase [unclassified Streptosporangium]